MRYFVGDVPADNLVIVPSRDGEPIDLDTVAFATVYVDGTPLNTSIEPDGIVGDWLPTSLFTEEGIYTVVVTLQYDDGGRETFEVPPIAVEDASTGWHTTVTARHNWPNSISDEFLYELLAMSRTQVEEYAPALPEDTKPPLRYRQAQLMQARNTLNAAKTDPSTSADGELFILRPFPLDKNIRQLLRPKVAVPVVGF